MLKHVVFDFDGTIADTKQLLPELINEVLEHFNMPIISDDDMERFTAMQWKDAVKEYGLKLYELPKLALMAQQKMKNKLHRVDLCKNMKEVLDNLSKEYTTNIISLNSKENIEHVINNHNIKTIGEIFSTKGKMTKDKVLKKYMEQYNIKTHEMLYVGDELGDIEACKQNNIKIVAVTWGVDSKEILSSGNPDHLVDCPYEIPNIAAAY